MRVGAFSTLAMRRWCPTKAVISAAVYAASVAFRAVPARRRHMPGRATGSAAVREAWN